MNTKRTKLSKKNKTKKLKKNKVVIGILTSPIPDKNDELNAKSYLYKSYVDWVNLKNVKIVPLQYNLPKHILLLLLNQINGIIMVGGAVNNLNTHKMKTYKQYLGTCKYIINHAKNENNKKRYFPLFSICLGFEIMGILAQKKIGSEKEFSKSSIDKIQNKGLYPLHFNDEDSRLKALFTSAERDQISKKPSVYYSHKLSFNLSKKYTQKIEKKQLISSSAIKNGKHYITSMEDRNYPFYSTLFHPEKPKFLRHIPNTNTSNLVSLRLIDFFVKECKKNKNRWLGCGDANNFFIENYPYYMIQKGNHKIPTYVFGEIQKHYN